MSDTSCLRRPRPYCTYVYQCTMHYSLSTFTRNFYYDIHDEWPSTMHALEEISSWDVNRLYCLMPYCPFAVEEKAIRVKVLDCWACGHENMAAEKYCKASTGCLYIRDAACVVRWSEWGWKSFGDPKLRKGNDVDYLKRKRWEWINLNSNDG